jgi:peroxiredoxin
MEQNWRILAILALVLVIVAIGAYAYVAIPPDDDGNGDTPPTKEKAPGFSVMTIDDEPVALDQLRGKIVVLDLMATWCQPCSLQMEALNQIRGQYPESRVVILSVDVDTDETEQQIRQFKEQHVANWRFASDSDNLGTKYDASSIPTIAIIDQDGMLHWRHTGVATVEDLRNQIDPLL